ncbi:hypothetical protein EDB84DRAFT_1504628 [Lactarius hengduanensis]|nr:hypothetical protein EDB84DRAFT_1504628 [Lactarius hengduanensis]
MEFSPQHFELSQGPRTQVNETQAIANVYYWYDGNVPFCTDATACRPLDDNFLPMNAMAMARAMVRDKTQVAHPHPYMNVDHCVSAQEYPDPYDIHLHHHQAPSPMPLQAAEDATSDTLTALSPSKPQMEPPARSQSAETPHGHPRSVQPLACFFCRGRKIACGPPVNLGTGDRTCEPCARRRLVCEYPAESYRVAVLWVKAASGRPQRR